MAAGDAIYVCRGGSVGGVDVDSLTHARLIPKTTFKIDNGPAGWPGEAGGMVSQLELAVELFGLDGIEMLGLLSDTEAEVILLTRGPANESLTVADVVFCEAAGAIEAPEKDAGGKINPAQGVRGFVTFGDNETFGDVLVAA